MFNSLCTIVVRDVKVYARSLGETFLLLVFFCMVTSLFSMILKLPQTMFREFAPGIIWVSVLLSSMLSYEMLYRLESEEDSMLQLFLSPFPLSLLLFGKALAHWVWTGLPLSIIAPLLGVAFGLSISGILALIFSLSLGTLILSFIAIIGVGLTFSLQRGGLLLTLLLIPLMMPVLLLGVTAVMSAEEGSANLAEMALLAALLLFTGSFSSIAAAAAFRAGVH